MEGGKKELRGVGEGKRWTRQFGYFTWCGLFATRTPSKVRLGPLVCFSFEGVQFRTHTNTHHNTRVCILIYDRVEIGGTRPRCTETYSPIKRTCVCEPYSLVEPPKRDPWEPGKTSVRQCENVGVKLAPTGSNHGEPTRCASATPWSHLFIDVRVGGRFSAHAQRKISLAYD